MEGPGLPLGARTRPRLPGCTAPMRRRTVLPAGQRRPCCWHGCQGSSDLHGRGSHTPTSALPNLVERPRIAFAAEKKLPSPFKTTPWGGANTHGGNGRWKAY